MIGYKDLYFTYYKESKNWNFFSGRRTSEYTLITQPYFNKASKINICKSSGKFGCSRPAHMR